MSSQKRICPVSPDISWYFVIWLQLILDLFGMIFFGAQWKAVQWYYLKSDIPGYAYCSFQRMQQGSKMETDCHLYILWFAAVCLNWEIPLFRPIVYSAFYIQRQAKRKLCYFSYIQKLSIVLSQGTLPIILPSFHNALPLVSDTEKFKK